MKHGSERVVDDARAHISTIKMLRNFHYIDEKGKDQGINGELQYRSVADISPQPRQRDRLTSVRCRQDPH